MFRLFEMKYSVFLFLISKTLLLCSQDTIVFRNTDKIIANVIEVGEFIKYHKFGESNGVIYNVKLAEVKSIQYKNGGKEEFLLIPAKKTIKFKSDVGDSLNGETKAQRQKTISIYSVLLRNFINEYNFGLEFGINRYLSCGFV